jgi:hydrogenase maturation protein HypF
LPGGEQAIKEPRRAALGLLFEIFGEKAFTLPGLKCFSSFSAVELSSLRVMLTGGVQSPFTSSVGRLFDAIAALAGLRQKVRFEGQAAMELEFAIEGLQTEEAYSFALQEHPIKAEETQSRKSKLVLDWEPLVQGVLEDLGQQTAASLISAKFHNALAEVILQVSQRIGLPRVALSGGCFQNRYLVERTIGRLEKHGFRAYWHQRVPPNDGGIALGQIFAASRR